MKSGLHKKIIKCLLKNGADPNITNYNNENVFEYVMKKDSSSFYNKNRYLVTRLLLKYGTCVPVDFINKSKKHWPDINRGALQALKDVFPRIEWGKKKS